MCPTKHWNVMQGIQCREFGQPVRWNANFHGTEITVANGLPELPMQVPHGLISGTSNIIKESLAPVRLS